MGRRRQIRIAHAEIDDIGAGIACSRLGPVDLLEHIRRQTADAVEIFHSLASDTPSWGCNRRHICHEAEFGLVRKSRSIKDLERIQAQIPVLVKILRLNRLLVPRTLRCASVLLVASAHFASGFWPAAVAWRSRAAASSFSSLARSSG